MIDSPGNVHRTPAALHLVSSYKVVSSYRERLISNRQESRMGDSKSMRAAIFVMSLVVSCAGCFAQSPDNKPTEPAVIGDVFLLDAANQTLKPLPAEMWEAVPKKTAFAHGGFFIQISGDHSSYRIKAGANPEFVFKIGRPESVAIYAFSLKKHKRFAEYADGDWGTRPIPGLPAEITQFGQSSFKLAPKSALAPGEYVIRTATKCSHSG